jgi:hypothetical protein
MTEKKCEDENVFRLRKASRLLKNLYGGRDGGQVCLR